jgi:hypothetical protein
MSDDEVVQDLAVALDDLYGKVENLTAQVEAVDTTPAQGRASGRYAALEAAAPRGSSGMDPDDRSRETVRQVP